MKTVGKSCLNCKNLTADCHKTCANYIREKVIERSIINKEKKNRVKA